MKYRKKALLTEAAQWLQPGDHPQVEIFHSQDLPGDLPGSPYCSICGNLMERHGLLDGINGEELICPGDYIVNDRNDLPYRVGRGEFESQYEPYVRPPRFASQSPSDLEQRKQNRKREGV